MSKTADYAMSQPPQPDHGFIHFPCGHAGTVLELEMARFSQCLSCQIKREKYITRQARIEALEWVGRKGHRFMEMNGNLHDIISTELCRLYRLHAEAAQDA